MTRGTRCLTGGLLALLLAALMAPAAAFAEAGPFWHHRNISKEGAGEKIEEKAPESFGGEGGEQKLKGTIAGVSIEITTKSQQVKGIIYNNALQGQSKFVMTFHEPTLTKPSLKECKIKIGENNSAHAFMHLSWKWNGQTKQLGESPQRKVQKPDGIVVGTEITSGATAIPKGEFTKITLSGSGCGVIAGSFPVEGSATAIRFAPANLEEWTRVIKLTYGEGKLHQHFWNGKESIGGETGLLFAGNPADLSGEGTLETPKQEVAAFEK
jgi:hypothetical protein